MNAEYISKMPLDDLLPMVRARLEQAGIWQDDFAGERAGWFAGTIDLIRARFRTLVEFATLGRSYFVDDLSFEFDAAAVKKNLQKDAALKTLLPRLADTLETVEPFNHETVELALRTFAEEHGVKAGLLINSSRTALTGQSVGPGMFDVFVAIGRERSVQRLRNAAHLVE